MHIDLLLFHFNTFFSSSPAELIFCEENSTNFKMNKVVCAVLKETMIDGAKASLMNPWVPSIGSVEPTRPILT